MKRQVVISNILIGVTALLGAVTVNLATAAIPASWQQYLWLAWPLAVVITIASIWLSIRYSSTDDDDVSRLKYDEVASRDSIILQINDGAKNVSTGREVVQTVIGGNVETAGGDFVSGGKIFIHRLDLADARNQRNHKATRQLVRRFWIDGVLKHSLYKEVLIRLDIKEWPDAVDNRPWDLILQQPGQPDQTIPPGAHIIEVFDQMNQQMLILGEPGSGKTTMLLELADALLQRVETDPTHPTPVVFNLSSWAENREPLAVWLITELRTKYNIPKNVAQRWVKNDELLLLLDGLDEVTTQHRGDCVKAINLFRQEHLVSLVVCSRTAEYESLNSRLKLQGAVLVQPLTLLQVDEYLDSVGSELAELRTTLHHAPDLQELATSPLMLGVMTLASQGASSAEIVAVSSTETPRQHLFDEYIRRMFAHRGIQLIYPIRQSLHWLAWLARNMYEQRQTVFLIEQLQPSWLETDLQRQRYVVMSRLLWGITKNISYALGYALIYGIFAASVRVGPGESLRETLSKGLSYGLNRGLIYGPSMAFILWLINGLLNPHQQTIMDEDSDQILVIETLTWTWTEAREGGLKGLLLGMIVGLSMGPLLVLLNVIMKVIIFGLHTTLPNVLGTALVSGLICGLILGFMGGLFLGLLGGSSLGIQDIKSWPNQGVWLSIRNGLFMGGVFGLVSGLLINILAGRQNGLIYGTLIGLSVSLLYGGRATVQHSIVRLLLYFRGDVPLNCARFLDYCHKRILLRKVGSGYIFIHRLLLEHFKNMTDEDIKRIADSVGKKGSWG